MLSLFRQLPKLSCTDKWEIGICRASVSEIMSSGQLGEIDWLPENHEDYRTDPFLRWRDGILFICYESFSYWRARGRIAELTVSGMESRPSIVARADLNLPLRGHLSYPYAIYWGGVDYFLLENSEDYRVPLFRVDASGQWQYVADLLCGDTFVDTSWLFHDGWHYLFTTRSQEPYRLLIFMSREFNGPYVAHPASGHFQTEYGETQRGGGTVFQWQGARFRSTQNHEGRYGTSLTIRQITELSPCQYAERSYAKLSPVEPYGNGLHTLSVCGEHAIIDGRRLKCSALAPVKKLWRKMRENRASRSDHAVEGSG